MDKALFSSIRVFMKVKEKFRCAIFFILKSISIFSAPVRIKISLSKAIKRIIRFDKIFH